MGAPHRDDGADLWALRKETRAGEENLVFTSERGKRLDHSNFLGRVLKPAALAAGIGEWIGFHTFRHTCATTLFRSGWNAVQVQKFLGHSDPGFALRTYVHLLPEDLPEPVTSPAAAPLEIEEAELPALAEVTTG